MFLRQWLEDLGKLPDRDLPNEFPEAIWKYVLPSVSAGDERAAHPRYSLAFTPPAYARLKIGAPRKL